MITVAYNSLRHFEALWTAERDFTWIVVDNGSTDGSVEFAETFADRVIRSGANVGFAIANNLGLREVATPYVAFANPDVRVHGSGWQERLASTIETTGGLVAPQLLNPDGTEQHNARGVPWLSAKVRNRLRPESERGRAYARSAFGQPTYCAWAMGAALAGRTDMIRSLGGWDESYFLYYEDHEIGLRAWRRGLSVVLDPEVRWTHEWQRATASPSLWAWKVELASMRTFYGDHPELLRRSARPGVTNVRLRRSGYGRLLANLWRPAIAVESRN